MLSVTFPNLYSYNDMDVLRPSHAFIKRKGGKVYILFVLLFSVLFIYLSVNALVDLCVMLLTEVTFCCTPANLVEN